VIRILRGGIDKPGERALQMDICGPDALIAWTCIKILGSFMSFVLVRASVIDLWAQTM